MVPCLSRFNTVLATNPVGLKVAKNQVRLHLEIQVEVGIGIGTGSVIAACALVSISSLVSIVIRQLANSSKARLVKVFVRRKSDWE
jgi:hypothetical protein